MIKQLTLVALVAAASAFSPSSRFGVVRQTAIAAEPVWAAPTEWKELDVEADLKKLEKEAEARLEAKAAELLAKIETTGAKSS